MKESGYGKFFFIFFGYGKLYVWLDTFFFFKCLYNRAGWFFFFF